MNTLRRIASVTALSALLLNAAPVLAHGGQSHHGWWQQFKDYTEMPILPAVQVNESGFGNAENVQVDLFKLVSDSENSESAGLYALTADGGSTAELWKATDRFGTEWEQVTDADFISEERNLIVEGISVFKGSVYLLFTDDLDFELWRWNPETEWEMVFEEANASRGLYRVRNMLYVASDEALFQSDDGENWIAAEFPTSVGSVSAMTSFKGKTYAVTTDAHILSSEDDGTGEWVEEQDYSGTFNSFAALATGGKASGRTLVVGGSSDNGGVILISSDGSTWETAVSDGFGNADNSSIVNFRMHNLRRTVQAYTYNENGFQIWEAGKKGDLTEWSEFRTDGVTDVDNVMATSVVQFRGRLFTGTRNIEDGGQVYVTQLRPPKPKVTSPEKGAEVTGTSVTITGTAQKGNLIAIRSKGKELVTTTVDEDGNWSVEMTDLEEGNHLFRAFAKYQKDGETSGKWSMPAQINFSSTTE